MKLGWHFYNRITMVVLTLALSLYQHTYAYETATFDNGDRENIELTDSADCCGCHGKEDVIAESLGITHAILVAIPQLPERVVVIPPFDPDVSPVAYRSISQCPLPERGPPAVI